MVSVTLSVTFSFQVAALNASAGALKLLAWDFMFQIYSIDLSFNKDAKWGKITTTLSNEWSKCEKIYFCSI